MAPGTKRKKPDRGDTGESGNRPSPHRPQNLHLAHTQQQLSPQSNGNASSRRPSRASNRSTASTPNSPQVTQASPTVMGPPPTGALQNRSRPVTPTSAAAPKPTLNSQPNGPTGSSKAPQTNRIITQPRVDTWATQGRKAVFDIASQALAGDDALTLCILFEELAHAAIDHVLVAEEVGSLVADILAGPSSDALDATSLFLDTVSTLADMGAVPAQLKTLLRASRIDPLRMRSDFENNLLSGLDLVRPTFPRVAIRKATHALYRQSNYNLLREESEGYSKLITEYFTTVQNHPPNGEVATETFQRVKALIGAFDLDVGRVLDVTLDVFANLLVKHNRFFVKMLRDSSWWPEQNTPHGIEWEEPAISALPRWATPGCPLWYYTDEEKEEQMRLRQLRDEQFWKRVDEIGIKAFFELGARRITSGAPTPPPEENDSTAEDIGTSKKKTAETADFEKIQKWTREWMAETKTLPPSGNRIAAQLLGFKLRFYASDARDKNDLLPDNLINLAALLIKIGFISLADLYPHLYPLDENMASHRSKLLKAKREREERLYGTPANALSMAEALPDEMPPAPGPLARLRDSESKAPSKSSSERGTPAPETEPASKLPEPDDQKIALLRSLLCIGAIPDAFFILGRFPWLLEVYPDLHKYLFRLAHYSLSKLDEWARTTGPEVCPSGRGSQKAGAMRASDYTPRRTLRWAKLEEQDAAEGIDYRFYWEDWADHVPICQNVDDVFRLCETLLKFIGFECGKDETLMTKLIKIGLKSLKDDPEPANKRRWLNLIHSLIGPSLSFTEQNAAIVNEAWELLSHYDIQTRYSFYKHWFGEKTNKAPSAADPLLPTLVPRVRQVKSDVKRLFGRISSENMREMGRAMAKIAIANPGFVFNMSLARAISHSNMIDCLVECCRYLTFLGFDCLNFSFINSLMTKRETRQGDGMLTQSWLKNTAYFIAKAYKRYSLLDPTPVLQLIASRLLNGDLSTMEIFEQILTHMAGIGPVLSLTDSQVYGLSAGPLLRAFTLEHYLGDKRQASKMSSKRLIKSLTDADLAAQILVALAIELERFVYRPELEEAGTPLKVIGTDLDRLHSNFGQYLDFLRTSLTMAEFDELVPNAVELIAEYGVGPAIAFTICRASLSLQANAARAQTPATPTKEKSPAEIKPSGEDAEMKDAVEAEPANGAMKTEDAEETKELSSDKVTQETSTPGDVVMEDSSSYQPVAAQGVVNAHVGQLANDLRAALPEQYGRHICLEFVVTFWELSLFDVYTVTPMKAYKEYDTAWKFYSDKAAKVPFAPYDRRDGNREAGQRRTAEVKGFQDQSAALREENKSGLSTVLKLRKYLQQEMHQWFAGIPMMDAKSEELHITILQDCFLPRITLSPEDALFCGAMLRYMHEIGVPGFRTMKILDRLFRQKLLSNIIFMCTEREATNLGRFLNDILKELNVWHADQSVYTKSAHGPKKTLPGFGRAFNPDRTPSAFVDFEDFRRVLFKWHKEILKALEVCLQSDEYMHIRNAINVLKAISPSFPRVDTMGDRMYQLVQTISENDSRDDLKLAAMSVSGDIKKGEKHRKSADAFRIDHKAAKAASAPAPARADGRPSGTPQPQEAAARLNATAPEFKPTTAATNGTSTPATGSKSQEEVTQKIGAAREETAKAVQDARPTNDSFSKPAMEPRSSGPHQRNNRDNSARSTEQSTPAMSPSTQLPAPPVSRPEGRVPLPPPNRHNLPARPESQASRPRLPERHSDRQPEYPSSNRADIRNSGLPEFGRPDRGGEIPREHPQREPFGDRREMSPGRRRGRTPERRDPGWGSRDSRDYQDDRMRPPPRDARAAPPPFHPREPRDPAEPPYARDPRDGRDRADPRGPLPPLPADTRPRTHGPPIMAADERGSYRRDYPPQAQQPADRASGPMPRDPMDRLPHVPLPRGGPPPHASDRGPINPERAAMMDDRPRTEGYRSDRDTRPERGSRPTSPRRGPPPYPGRGDPMRDPRDERPYERPAHERTSPNYYPPHNKDWREAGPGSTPTGPRGGRNDPAAGRLSRDTFATPRAPPPVQDPNYGRLNQPSENIPSGPRSKRSAPAPVAAPKDNTAPPVTPTGPAADQGIHPSRMANIGQTSASREVVNPPSGPRGPGRAPTGPAAAQPPATRGPPTGPASGDRNTRNPAGHTLRTINNVLQPQPPSGNFTDTSTSGPPPQIRGRGAARAGGYADTPHSGSAGGSSLPGTPNPMRPEPPAYRSDRVETSRTDARHPEDARYDSRGHREGRRSDRSGGQRSRSTERSDKKSDERGSRNGQTERSGRNEEQDRMGERDRGSGKEKRAGDREGGRRERDREGGDLTVRESRERRDRNGRDDGRESGRGEEMGQRRGLPAVPAEAPAWPADGRGGEPRHRGDRRRDEPRDSRGDGRKRGPGEEPPAQRDMKRSRRSNG
ncbi:hypothetical protein M011DRAFT_449780 [Sporormia fimetaria CBS 119925]|uniref:THO complex subunit 2 n=1 Tax=Sporormia fimetaria CBS 119925 TaxID=1340428 RepID=A0A6A6V4Z3_9PLEO|nr:hypothetical protein M011DRAFT_449780 [Sporormia fimetaria CBS 119925]